jgi:hypothetical protein
VHKKIFRRSSATALPTAARQARDIKTSEQPFPFQFSLH